MPLRQRIDTVRLKVREAADAAHKDASKIRLIAVSKTHPPGLVEEAYLLGLREFGENYADELVTKSAALRHLPDIHWVFIGNLQSNKIQKIVKHADEIQSIASQRHATYVQRYAHEYGKLSYPVWINVNAGNEDTKHGANFDDMEQIADFIKKDCPNLALQGLMAIPPATYSDEVYKAKEESHLPHLYKELRIAASKIGLGKLSIGMSGDLRIAIAAGSDCIRLGTAIFGERQKN